jgi:hypothetical protein
LDGEPFSITDSTYLNSCYQLNEYELLEPGNTLKDRLKGRLDGKDIKTMAARLGTTKKVLQIFPEKPPEDCLHIYVQPSAGESLALNVVLHTSRTDKVTSYPYSPHCGLITPSSFLHMNCAEISCLLPLFAPFKLAPSIASSLAVYDSTHLPIRPAPRPTSNDTSLHSQQTVTRSPDQPQSVQHRLTIATSPSTLLVSGLAHPVPPH